MHGAFHTRNRRLDKKHNMAVSSHTDDISLQRSSLINGRAIKRRWNHRRGLWSIFVTVIHVTTAIFANDEIILLIFSTGGKMSAKRSGLFHLLIILARSWPCRRYAIERQQMNASTRAAYISLGQGALRGRNQEISSYQSMRLRDVDITRLKPSAQPRHDSIISISLIEPMRNLFMKAIRSHSFTLIFPTSLGHRWFVMRAFIEKENKCWLI